MSSSSDDTRSQNASPIAAALEPGGLKQLPVAAQQWTAPKGMFSTWGKRTPHPPGTGLGSMFRRLGTALGIGKSKAARRTRQDSLNSSVHAGTVSTHGECEAIVIFVSPEAGRFLWFTWHSALS